MKHPQCSSLCKKLLPDHDGSTLQVCDSQRERARRDVPSPVRKLEAITPHTNFRPRNNCHSNLLIGIIQQQLLWRQITVFQDNDAFHSTAVSQEASTALTSPSSSVVVTDEVFELHSSDEAHSHSESMQLGQLG